MSYLPKIYLLFKYGISGVIATVTNVVALYVLTDILGMWYLAAAVISFLIAFVVSFVLQKFWAFENRSTDVLSTQASIYLLIQLWDLGINTLALYVLVDWLGVWYILAQVISSTYLAVQNFLLYRAFIFKKPTQ